MREMLGEPLDVVSVVTKDCVQRMSKERESETSFLFQSPISGIMYEIGSPSSANGIIAGNKNTNSGNL